MRINGVKIIAPTATTIINLPKFSKLSKIISPMLNSITQILFCKALINNRSK